MLKKTLVIAALCLAFASPAFAQLDCKRPSRLKVPDPAKAEAKDFEKAYADLKAYHAALTAYHGCLQKEVQETSAEYLSASQDYEKAVRAYNALADKANKAGQ